jgi:hypothetical protein
MPSNVNRLDPVEPVIAKRSGHQRRCWSRPPNAATHRGADLQRFGQLLWQDDIELLAKRVGEQVRIAFHRNCGADVDSYDPMIRAGRI